MKKRPVIMDCDPGTDDAMALLMINAAPELELIAVTTVAGNLNREITAMNALKIVSYFKMGVPVSAGAYPMMKKFEPLDISIMGASGMGKAQLPDPEESLDKLSSVELLHQKIRESAGEAEILATGPLTNLALLFIQYPEIRGMIRRIVIMGGAVEGGNLTPKAEFNIYTDAEAAKIVFQSGVPIIMAGLDVSYKTPVFKEDMALITLGKGKAARFMGDIMFYPGDEKHPFPEDGIFIYDALAAAAIIDPTCMEIQEMYVDVETKGELTYGETVCDVHGYLNKTANTGVAVRCDKAKFLRRLRDTVAFYDR